MGYWKQSAKTLVSIIIISYLLSGEISAHPEGQTMTLTETIESWVNLYLSGTKNAQQFLDSIAKSVDKSYIESGDLSFMSNNQSFEQSYLSFHTQAKPHRSEYLELTIKPEANLKRSHIEALWGESWPGVIAPDTFNAVLWFHPLIKPNFEYAGRIEVALDDSPDNPESNVIRVTITRDDPKTAVSPGKFDLDHSVTSH